MNPGQQGIFAIDCGMSQISNSLIYGLMLPVGKVHRGCNTCMSMSHKMCVNVKGPSVRTGLPCAPPLHNSRMQP